MSVAVVFNLILSVSLQACTARRLGHFGKENINGGSLDEFSHKKVEVLSSEAHRLVNLETNLKTEAESRKILHPSYVVGLPTKKFEAAEEEKYDNKGKKLIRQSIIDEELLPITTKIQDDEQKRQDRVMIESRPPDNSEETDMVSEENEIGEDIVVMDYAQPHRKPPIHNKEP